MGRTLTAAIAAVSLAGLLGGCQLSPGQVQGGAMPVPAGDSAGYLDHISQQKQVSEAEAFRGVLLLTGQQRELTFAQAVEELQRQRLVSPLWSFQADRPMTKGKTAYMVYQVCRMHGGLTLTLTGPSERYCLKELQYRGMMSPGVPYNAVTGMEYVAVLTRADEFRQTGEVSAIMKLEAPEE